MATKVTPTERRLAAIGTLVRKYLDSNGQLIDEELSEEFEQRELDNDRIPARAAFLEWMSKRIANDIRTLLPLGRTNRWDDAVNLWADLVEDIDNRHNLVWAINQGCIHAGYAALPA